ncbi:MAG: ATP-binding protein [Paenibacillaceae bacterium]|nr:ATP-binding protein [Paenibacillaceae bacterium]
MKLLKIQAYGLKLFEKEIEIDFYAKQRVSADKNEMLTNVFSNIYINNVISMVGINASGKTTTLKVISFALQLLKNEPINTIKSNDILDGLEEHEEVIFDIFFISGDGKLSRLNSVIKTKQIKTELKDELNKNYFISRETLWTKSINTVRSKKDLFDFSNVSPSEERKEDELFLSDDVSVMIAFNKKQNNSINILDSINWTNFNGLRVVGDFPISLVQFLDPSIEHLECNELKNDKKIEIRLKFFNKKEIIMYSPLEISKYLSSGTVKGLNVFMMAMIILQDGGYLIIDELENHFNKEIVSTLIRFFMDSDINKNGAVLIFSTHYVELLDIFERNDNIYVIKNISGICIENLSDLLQRNDIKKSELFQSGFLENTTPSYNAYINFKRALTKAIKNAEV